jgi:hypothetical protein
MKTLTANQLAHRSTFLWGGAVGLALGIVLDSQLRWICGDWEPLGRLSLLLLIWCWMKRQQ